MQKSVTTNATTATATTILNNWQTDTAARRSLTTTTTSTTDTNVRRLRETIDKSRQQQRITTSFHHPRSQQQQQQQQQFEQSFSGSISPNDLTRSSDSRLQQQRQQQQQQLNGLRNTHHNSPLRNISSASPRNYSYYNYKNDSAHNNGAAIAHCDDENVQLFATEHFLANNNRNGCLQTNYKKRNSDITSASSTPAKVDSITQRQQLYETATASRAATLLNQQTIEGHHSREAAMRQNGSPGKSNYLDGSNNCDRRAKSSTLQPKSNRNDTATGQYHHNQQQRANHYYQVSGARYDQGHLPGGISTRLAPSLSSMSVTQATGRFVNYYPPSRQTQSPPTSTSHYRNYSFHVPLYMQRSPMNYHNHHHQQQHHYYHYPPHSNQYPSRPQSPAFSRQSSSRYAYAKLPPQQQSRQGPADEVSDAVVESDQDYVLQTPIISKPFNKSIRSQTIHNLNSTILDNPYEQRRDPLKLDDDANQIEDAYNLRRRSLRCMASEGDLLRTDIVRYCDGGWDNPFKPDTELSWEADVMVRLMKRGYPISELTKLVEAAKLYKTDVNGESQQKQATHNLRQETSGKRTTGALNQAKTKSSYSLDRKCDQSLSREKDLTGNKTDRNKILRRQSSVNQLDDKKSASKQVWADTLKRTKSMPRFTLEDADSLDKLITSIENEISSLLDEEKVNGKEQMKSVEKPTKGKNKSLYSSKRGDSQSGHNRKTSNIEQISPKHEIRTTKTVEGSTKPKKENKIRKYEDKRCCIIQ